MNMDKIKVAAIVILSVLLVVCAILFAISAGRDIAGDINALPSPEIPKKEQAASLSADDIEVDTGSLSRVKIGWGPGTEVNDKNQPVGAISAQEKYSGLGGHFIFPADEKILYLTFDLGYENGYTETILDALDARGIKGTFFITMDYVKEAPHIVRRIIEGSHTLGNHTVKHPSVPDISDERIISELMDLHSYIEGNFGYSMTVFRYPMGEFSEYSLKFIDNLGYKSIFWSFAYVDWKTDAQPSREAGMEKITSALHGGAIYLLHAVSSTNAAIMGDFLDTAIAEHYSFGLIDQKLGLAEPAQPGILP